MRLLPTLSVIVFLYVYMHFFSYSFDSYRVPKLHLFPPAAKNSCAAKSWAQILPLLAFCTRCNGSTSQKRSTSGSRRMSTRVLLLLLLLFLRPQTPWDLRPAVTGAGAFEVRALGCSLFFLYVSPSATPAPRNPPTVRRDLSRRLE